MKAWLLPAPCAARRPGARLLQYVIVLMVGFAVSMAMAADGEGAGVGVLGGTVGGTLERGGTVMYLILALSILGLAFILEASWKSRRSAILPKPVADALGSRSPNAVRDVVAEGKSSIAHAILTAGYAWRNGSSEQIAAAIEEKTDELLWTLKRSARPLGIIANTAPLLGLLGTVIGIIQAFDTVARSGALGDPGALAGGISKALLTTCFGLIVAIPLLLAYHFFVGRIETRTRACEILAKEHLILPPERPEAVPAGEG